MHAAERTQNPSSGSLNHLYGLISRGEFFSALFILACLNGLGWEIAKHVRSEGWVDAVLGTFGVSAIVWIACFGGIRLILHERQMDTIHLGDLVVGLFLLVLIILPIGRLSWLAVTILSIYLLATDASSLRRRGALILLACTAPMFWSRLLFRYFANFILDIDASLIGKLLGTSPMGNVVPFADQSGNLVIFPGCSSLANVSLALLAWVTISQWSPHRASFKDLFWCFLAVTVVITINVTRIAIMGLSQMHYQALHGQWGEAITNLLILVLTCGICFFGAKRDLFARV